MTTPTNPETVVCATVDEFLFAARGRCGWTWVAHPGFPLPGGYFERDGVRVVYWPPTEKTVETIPKWATALANGCFLVPISTPMPGEWEPFNVTVARLLVETRNRALDDAAKAAALDGLVVYTYLAPEEQVRRTILACRDAILALRDKEPKA